ncbi:hypothetical protein ACOSQ4_033376 [Xanthoceras sorbifolium]
MVAVLLPHSCDLIDTLYTLDRHTVLHWLISLWKCLSSSYSGGALNDEQTLERESKGSPNEFFCSLQHQANQLSRLQIPDLQFLW